MKISGYLEWTNTGLCIPRKCASQAAFFTADIGSIPTDKKLEECIDIIANTIEEWNTKKQYKEQSNYIKNDKEANCQDFVLELFQKLKVNSDHLHTGSLGIFLKNLREKGQAEMVFEMDDEFRKKFKIEEKKKIFSVHKELDLFVKDLLEKCVDFEYQYSSDWMLLKSFDRSFWLRHYKSIDEEKNAEKFKKSLQKSFFKSKEKWTPLYSEENDICKCICPFSDPIVTESIKHDH